MPSASGGPIFVVGSQGSGTTLMRLILDSHQNIALAQETGFARALLANEWIPYAAEVNAQWYQRIGLSREELESDLGEFYGRLFARFAEQRGATRWGDKTPYHVWHMPLLARVFPDGVFIGMVRHPGAGASSRSRRMGHSWSGSLEQWRRRNTEMLYQGSRLGGRFTLCRYEDLVLRPEPVLRDLFEWLDEPWSDQVLTFHEVHRARGTPSQVEGWTHSDDPIDVSRVDAWTADMSPRRWSRLREGKVLALSTLLGYEPDRALPASGWGEVSGALLLDGHALTRVMEADRAIDWTKHPQPSLPNRPLRIRDLTAVKRVARGRAGEGTAQVGRWAVHRLRAQDRRRVRSVWWRVRSWLRRAEE